METEIKSEQMQFVESHQPVLPSGEYSIFIEQQVFLQNKLKDSHTIEKKVVVRGERFNLDKSDINTCFPPNGSEGAYFNYLPHIVLKSGTLPWERNAGKEEKHIPWLALLLFDEDEVSEIRTVSVELKDLNGENYCKIDLETIESKTDKCDILEIPEILFKRIVPTKDDLTFLAHIRRVNNEKKENYNPDNRETEYSVIVGNRIPQEGKKSVVYLVSLENFYNDKFENRYKPKNGMIQLVALKNWCFTLAREEDTFVGIAKNLRHNSGTLKYPYDTSKQKNELLEKLLSMSYTLMPHHTREGEKTVSIYKGPLISYHSRRDIKLPVSCSDELVHFHTDTGMFDVSYAAAWQIGRLLAIKNKGFTVALYKWKKLLKQKALIKNEAKKIEEILGDTGIENNEILKSPELEDYEKEINTWLGQLKNLTGIPFNYIIADEKMVPKESMKFFTVDMNWIDCLIDGAMSIGRVTSKDQDQDNEKSENIQTSSDSAAKVLRNKKPGISGKIDKLTGIVIRSKLVSDWPGLEFQGFESDRKKMAIFNIRRPTDDLLLCLFEGDLKQIDINLPPEGFHFGISKNGEYNKKLRDLSTGKLIKDKKVQVPFRSGPEKDSRVLDIKELAKTLKTKTSAEFAVQMVESASKISFIRRQV